MNTRYFSVYVGNLSPRVRKVSYNLVTKICPCNIQRFFSEEKIVNFIGKKMFFFFLLKT